MARSPANRIGSARAAGCETEDLIRTNLRRAGSTARDSAPDRTRRLGRAATSILATLGVTLLACSSVPAATPFAMPDAQPPIGAFLSSDASGTEAVAGFASWLGGPEVTVGHTYLPPNSWADVRGPEFILRPWAEWRADDPGRMLVLNVPMLVPNEVDASDDQVAALLHRAASGEFNENFRVLAERLIALGAADAIVVPGWEMNGTTYTHRCAPDPDAWKQHFRGVVAAMRSVPGQQFRFDFTPSRGRDDIGWTECYPGDDVVDIIGMDTYDQAPGDEFSDYVEQPYGLQDQVDFAAARGKPISFAEWGLFRYGDRPEFIRGMFEWITSHNVVYHTISDYCPHGVWRCEDNPKSSAVFRDLFGSVPLR